MLNDAQIREVFHFCFLERLLKLSDPSLFILKGGLNLRFFFNSPRYSEDMDIDVLAGSVETLKKNGYKILQDPAFKRSLRLFDIEDIEINDPGKSKQTAITQRFRFALITPAGHRLPTKLEFSRREQGKSNDTPLELVSSDIARQYKKLSYRCHHYSGDDAVAQKIAALAGRVQTQARDVFDLAILFSGGYSFSTATEAQTGKSPLSSATLDQAIECLTGLSWDDYLGQVVEFLDTTSKGEFGTKKSWESMQALVLDRLGENA